MYIHIAGPRRGYDNNNNNNNNNHYIYIYNNNDNDILVMGCDMCNIYIYIDNTPIYIYI